MKILLDSGYWRKQLKVIIKAEKLLKILVLLIVLSIFPLFLTSPSDAAGKEIGDIGSFDKWAKIEISMTGPDSIGTGIPNPFSVFVDVMFTGPSGQKYIVPGFYNGDGGDGLNGNIWMVRFSADEIGSWTFISQSTNSQLDGYVGSFMVNDVSANAPDFYRWGRLEYTGTATNKIRYLKFRDGPYWLKAGSDDPENFLGDFSNYDTQAKRKSAIDYLSGKGINSQYFMTHNVDGDNEDVWPWLGATTSEAKSNGSGTVRFDIIKLEEWLELFEYMQIKGVVPYIVLEDDSAWTGYDHQRYYRELIARFGHMPTLLFNIGEEHNENYSLSEALNHAQDIKDLDPYDHPVGIHNINGVNDTYIDSSQVDFTAIQTKGSDPLTHNSITVNWINASKLRNKRVLMVGYDEPRPLMDRRGWWSTYLGGGVWEVHVDKPYDRPVSAWETAWNEIGGARTFMESIPFWEMEPNNSLVVSGTGFALAKPGEVYALYLPSGGTVTLDLTAGATYDYSWWNGDNHRNGSFQNGGSVGGGQQSFTSPDSGDWALKIVKSGGGSNGPPVASNGNISVAPNESVDITMAYSDSDGPGPYTYTITQDPTKGTLSGSGGTITYTAMDNVSGTDTFKWKVNDGLDDSNVATVTISISVQGNQSPVANDQTVNTTENKEVSIALSYTDTDGPGPYTFTITQSSANGTITPDNVGSNDYIYNPNPNYTGMDSFHWKVNDGESSSNIAMVVINVNQLGNELIVSNLNVSSNRNYEVVSDGLQDGAIVYTDRGYTFTTVPSSLQGATYIKTANDDKNLSGSSFLTFDVNQDVTVYIAYDDRISVKPSWLSLYTDIGDNIDTGMQFSLYAKNFSAGTITLGGNEGGGNSSMYSVIIQGASSMDIVSPKPPTKLRKKE